MELCQDRTNKIKFSVIYIIKKSLHTPFPVILNINAKQERFEMNYNTVFDVV